MLSIEEENKYNKWHLVGFLFFNYHNDARSNKYQMQISISYVWKLEISLLISVFTRFDPFESQSAVSFV